MGKKLVASKKSSVRLNSESRSTANFVGLPNGSQEKTPAGEIVKMICQERNWMKYTNEKHE